jgi:hypothetical protein
MTRGTLIADFAEDLLDPIPSLSLDIRVPVITSPYPRWNYVTAVVVGRWPFHEGPEPSDEELRVVESFHEEYCSHWYGPPHTGWRARDMDLRPFDVDGGAVGRFLTKYANGGWGYRLRTWNRGPTFVPTFRDEPASLVAVMDRIHSIGDKPMDRWVQWKADHPDIFGGAS